MIDNCINRSTVNTTEGGSGGIVSRAFTGSTVSNCRNEGTVSGKGSVNGGIVANGQPDATEVTDCHNEADIVLSNTMNGQYAAGIIGRTYMLNNVGSSTVISGCTNSGRIVAKGNSGGIVGALNMGATVRECVNTGTIVNTGGILGNSLGATWVYDCVNHGKIEAHWQYAGGVAGLIGSIHGTATITNSYNAGEVVTEAAGGAAGVANIAGKRVKTYSFNITKVSGVDGVEADKEVASRTYFDLGGHRIAAPAPGSVCIVRTVYTDGTSATKKLLVP